MSKSRLMLSCVSILLALVIQTLGQEVAQRVEDPVSRRLVTPRLVRFSSVLSLDDASSGPRAVLVTFSLYDAAQGGTPLWLETQNVQLDGQGHYTVLLGAATTGGMPVRLFGNGEARWLGIRLAEEGAAEQPRVALVSVPYALAAADAQSLNGRPVTDFQLTRAAAQASGDAAAAGSETSGAVSSTTNTVNRVAKFTATDTVGDSQIFDNGTNVGVGTTAPNDKLQINGNVLLTGQTTHQVTLTGAVTSGRLGQDSTGFFFSSDTPNKLIRFLASNGSLFEAVTINPVGSERMQINGNLTLAGTTTQLSMQGANAGGRLGQDDNGFFLSSDTPGKGIRFFTSNGSLAEVVNITGNRTVGIGTSSPLAKLDVVDSSTTQTGRFIQNGAGAGSFSVGTPPPTGVRGDATSATGVTAGVLGITSATLGRGVLGESLSTTGQNMGVYGVAVNSPDGSGVWGEATNTVGDAVGVFGRSSSNSGTGVFGDATAGSGDAVGVAGRSSAAGGTGVQGEVTASTGENYGVAGRVFNSTNTASTAGMFINTGSGSILVGRTSAAGGAANVFRVATNGQVFGSAFNTSGADFAESVNVKEQKAEYQPGDVIAIDTTGVRRFTKVNRPYSSLVAGIYSTKPGVLATPHSMEDPRIATEEIPLAVVGIVPCKVTNENGEIHPGDLLVASSRAGYAMKGTDRKRMNGAVIGKALQPMKGATGVIEVLVSLQ